MKHENRNENTSRKELDMLGMRRPRWVRRVIRSLGDDVRVVAMERMVAQLRRERLVAHDFTTTSFLESCVSNLKEQARHHPRWDKRVIKSLDDEESVDPKERMVAECQ